MQEIQSKQGGNMLGSLYGKHAHIWRDEVRTWDKFAFSFCAAQSLLTTWQIVYIINLFPAIFIQHKLSDSSERRSEGTIQILPVHALLLLWNLPQTDCLAPVCPLPLWGLFMQEFWETISFLTPDITQLFNHTTHTQHHVHTLMVTSLRTKHRRQLDMMGHDWNPST